MTTETDRTLEAIRRKLNFEPALLENSSHAIVMKKNPAFKLQFLKKGYDFLQMFDLWNVMAEEEEKRQKED